MVQHIFNKTFTALFIAFAYTLLLGHNLLPHQHAADAEPVAHHDTTTPPGHQHSDDGQADAGNAMPGADHFLSDHQHSFADNKIHHLDSSSEEIKLSKKQALPVLVCCLAFHYRLFRIPDKVPDLPAYLFPPTDFSSRAHALRGPPVA